MSVWAPLKLPDSVGGVRVPRRTRETPLTLRLAELGWLSESLGSAEALSGSVHSQAVFTAANGPREVSVSLRHPTVSMPSRDAKSHGTDVPWNGDEEDWPRARDMYHAILRDEFGSDIADTMWYDKVPTDSFDFDVETACLSILNCEKRRNFKLSRGPVWPKYR